MSQSFTELLILILVTLGTGYLLFIAGVIQGVMEGMKELEFKSYLTSMYNHALKSPYNLTISLVPFIALIPYYVVYGFNHWWFTAGMAMYVLASTASKIFNLPIYKRVLDPALTDTTKLREERRKLRRANTIRATLSLLALVIIMLQFA
jgi:hypothetical protein